MSRLCYYVSIAVLIVLTPQTVAAVDCGVCRGGANEGAACAVDAECAGGTCSLVNVANCVHGVQKLTASDSAPFQGFGSSVSVSGDTAVVGAYADDCAAGAACGSAYVYRFDGATWVQEQNLTASDAAAGDRFGWSVFVLGDAADYEIRKKDA